MNRTLQIVCVVALAAVIALPAAAQEKKKKKKRGERQPQQIALVMKKLEAANVGEEHIAKVKEVAKELAPKFQELNAKRREAIGPDTMKKMAEARKAAVEAGKKGKEAQAAAMDVLSDKQKETMKELTQAQAKLTADFRAKVVDIIGVEKAKELKLQRRNAGEKKKRKKKDAA